MAFKAGGVGSGWSSWTFFFFIFGAFFHLFSNFFLSIWKFQFRVVLKKITTITISILNLNPELELETRFENFWTRNPNPIEKFLNPKPGTRTRKKNETRKPKPETR